MLSQRQAASTWNLSRGVIQRAIKAGKLSQTSDKLIDPAEMLRVFGEPNRPTGRLEEPQEPPTEDAEKAALRAENEGLKALLAEKDGHIEDLRKTVALLGLDKKPGWWKRFTGRA